MKVSRSGDWWSNLAAAAERFIQPVVDLLVQATDSLSEWGAHDARWR
jgi:hypothetical protein